MVDFRSQATNLSRFLGLRPTSDGHNFLVRYPFHANFISIRRSWSQLSFATGIVLNLLVHRKLWSFKCRGVNLSCCVTDSYCFRKWLFNHPWKLNTWIFFLKWIMILLTNFEKFVIAWKVLLRSLRMLTRHENWEIRNMTPRVWLMEDVLWKPQCGRTW